jgi:hypothetical protein
MRSAEAQRRVTEVRSAITEELVRFFRTGDTDPRCSAWSGEFMERARRAHEDIRDGLVREVGRLVGECASPPISEPDTVGLTRRKVAPMVRGLFPRAEHDAVLTMLETSVVFVTSENVESLLRGHAFDSSAWTLANLYLASVGAQLLSATAPRLVGFSEETTCYVSPRYFDEDDPFADFIVHEAAHVFHNCKRRTVGLRETSQEWLLDIEFRKRETFAYSCEAYAQVLAGSRSPADRRESADMFSRVVRISDDRVDSSEVANIVQSAVRARNGWKVIHARCSPRTREGEAMVPSSQSS